MASAIDTVLFNGRDTIGITGYFNGSNVTIDLNVTTVFNSDYESTVTEHPIEKDSTNLDSISDYVIPKMPTLSMECYLSNDLNILDSITSFSNQSKSAKDKLKTLVYFQRKGTVIKLEGYGTGGGLIGKVFSFLDSGVNALFNSSIKDSFFLGLDSDIIENIVISSIKLKRTVDIGTDIQATIGFKRIQIAEAEIGIRGVSKKTTVAQKGNVITPEVQPPDESKSKEVIKSIGKKGKVAG